ncbi:hypothetical protein R50345_05970 [Paenibacillus sp. FSL R5-0345]|nr:hypothetical protein R50345_05970 [Paenibacillus sp. FSL R5-0345]
MQELPLTEHVEPLNAEHSTLYPPFGRGGLLTLSVPDSSDYPSIIEVLYFFAANTTYLNVMPHP